ncbi:MAG TPA: DUF4383 domain-containing protein [Candidatus Saccharimonadales bacterium]|nr:DUF4383 domain-containing protein [Candidatus Saccharimonadales bacterium]
MKPTSGLHINYRRLIIITITKKLFTTVFGTVIILVTLTNFLPFASTKSGNHHLLFGLFIASASLIVFHLSIGIIALATATYTHYSVWFLRIFGLVFAFAAIVGFASGHTVLGILPINLADNLLHSFFAIALLTAGFAIQE